MSVRGAIVAIGLVALALPTCAPAEDEGDAGAAAGATGPTSTLPDFGQVTNLSGGESVADVVARTLPAVVHLQQGKGVGSGFLVKPTGVVLTNNHVVDAGDSVTATLASGATVPGRVTWRHKTLDLAHVQLEQGSYPAVPVGDSDTVRVGEEVIAIGFPLGSKTPTVSVGIVSAKRANRLQTDAAVNPGNSGGPLLNKAGQVIGVVSARMTTDRSGNQLAGVGFAIPINDVEGVEPSPGVLPATAALGTPTPVPPPEPPADLVPGTQWFAKFETDHLTDETALHLTTYATEWTSENQPVLRIRCSHDEARRRSSIQWSQSLPYYLSGSDKFVLIQTRWNQGKVTDGRMWLTGTETMFPGVWRKALTLDELRIRVTRRDGRHVDATFDVSGLENFVANLEPGLCGDRPKPTAVDCTQWHAKVRAWVMQGNDYYPFVNGEWTSPFSEKSPQSHDRTIPSYKDYRAEDLHWNCGSRGFPIMILRVVTGPSDVMYVNDAKGTNPPLDGYLLSGQYEYRSDGKTEVEGSCILQTESPVSQETRALVNPYRRAPEATVTREQELEKGQDPFRVWFRDGDRVTLMELDSSDPCKGALYRLDQQVTAPPPPPHPLDFCPQWEDQANSRVRQLSYGDVLKLLAYGDMGMPAIPGITEEEARTWCAPPPVTYLRMEERRQVGEGPRQMFPGLYVYRGPNGEHHVEGECMLSDGAKPHIKLTKGAAFSYRFKRNINMFPVQLGPGSSRIPKGEWCKGALYRDPHAKAPPPPTPSPTPTPTYVGTPSAEVCREWHEVVLAWMDAGGTYWRWDPGRFQFARPFHHLSTPAHDRTIPGHPRFSAEFAIQHCDPEWSVFPHNRLHKGGKLTVGSSEYQLQPGLYGFSGSTSCILETNIPKYGRATRTGIGPGDTFLFLPSHDEVGLLNTASCDGKLYRLRLDRQPTPTSYVLPTLTPTPGGS